MEFTLARVMTESSGFQRQWPWKVCAASVPRAGPRDGGREVSPLQLFPNVVWAWLLVSQLLSSSPRDSRACLLTSDNHSS